MHLPLGNEVFPISTMLFCSYFCSLKVIVLFFAISQAWRACSEFLVKSALLYEKADFFAEIAKILIMQQF